MSFRYDEARAAFEYLESIVDLEDQLELDAERLFLMRNPTKRKAAEMYEAGIRLWLQEHYTTGSPLRVKDIAVRYNPEMYS